MEAGPPRNDAKLSLSTGHKDLRLIAQIASYDSRRPRKGAIGIIEKIEYDTAMTSGKSFLVH